jgi:hypothetical protein
LIKQAFYLIGLKKDENLLTGLLRISWRKLIIDNDNHGKRRERARYTSPSLLTEV